MARYRHPFTVGLNPSEWPDGIRQRWDRATAEGDILLDGGPASRWTPKTRLSNQNAMGQLVRFAVEQHLILDGDFDPRCLEAPNLKIFVEKLRNRMKPAAAVSVLRRASSALLATHPDLDRTLLKDVTAELDRRAKAGGKDLFGLPRPDDLLRVGEEMMDQWQKRETHDPRINAADYRTGLMIAFLALCLIRLAKLAQMIIGQHIDISRRPVRMCFEASETKGKRPIMFDWPEHLDAWLGFYLDHVRPILARDERVLTAMWPSLHNRPMQEHGIYTAITRATTAKLGHPVTPHMFRDAAATFIAEMTPERAHLAAGVLQHTSFETTRKHYVRGQQHGAVRRYHAAIEGVLRDEREDVT